MSSPAALPDLARVASAFANIPHCRLLGMRLDEVRRGSGMMSLDYDEKLIGNPRTHVVHSGVITALLDTLCGLVVMTKVPEGTPLATLDLRIDYLRPATPGETIRATAECYKVTENVAFVRGARRTARRRTQSPTALGASCWAASASAPGRWWNRRARGKAEGARAEVRRRAANGRGSARDQRSGALMRARLDWSCSATNWACLPRCASARATSATSSSGRSTAA